MSRIAIDARDYTTGSGRYMYRLLQYLEHTDTKNEYLILLQPRDMEAYEFTNPRFQKIACPHKAFSFDEQIGFKRQLEELNADLVHFGMVQQPIWYKGTVVTSMQDLTTMRFKNPSKNPFVFFVKQQIYKWVNKEVAKKSAAIITISNFVKQDIIDYTGVSADKITVTYEAADTIPDSPAPVESLQNKKFIMYLGRPTPHKNLNRLITAFQILQESHPDLWLALAGKKDVLYERIEEQARVSGIKNIVFTDFISEGQLKWMYKHCAVYAFPSLSEGFGLPALEALQHGAPLASTNATCSPEIYGDAANYFNPLDVADMAAKIGEVLDNPILRKDLIAKGKVQAAKYSWQRMAEQTLAVYESVLKNKDLK